MRKKLEKVKKERSKAEKDYEKEMQKVQKDTVKDDKEHKGMRKVLWLIIRDLDAESGVEREGNPGIGAEEVVRSQWSSTSS